MTQKITMRFCPSADAQIRGHDVHTCEMSGRLLTRLTGSTTSVFELGHRVAFGFQLQADEGVQLVIPSESTPH